MLPPILSDFSSIEAHYQGILLDAYGVFWGGNAFGLLPGSKEKMKQWVDSGKTVGILSNSTQLALQEKAKFEKNELFEGVHYHFLVTSGELARTIFLTHDLPFKPKTHKFWLFGKIHPLFSSHTLIFQDSLYQETDDIKEADFIYVAVPNINGKDQLDPELFRENVKAMIEHRLPMICPNSDLFAHEGSPPQAVVRQGSIAKLYEEFGGQVIYIGKPHSKAFTTALELFTKFEIFNIKQILMVGDTPETDIRGARKVGLDSALLIETGIMKDRIKKLGSKTALALKPEETPTYYIKALK